MRGFDFSQTVDGFAIAPEIALWVFACAAFLIEWLVPRRNREEDGAPGFFSAEAMAMFGLIAALALVLWQARAPERVAFTGTFVLDGLGIFFRALCILTPLVLMASTWEYMRGRPNRPEFYGLLLLATSGMTLMASSNDLILLFLSIEFLSITSYVLVGYLKTSRRSTEASIKYFLFGAICSALMLYGMSLLYGITGSTNFQYIQEHMLRGEVAVAPAIFVLMVVFFFAGIGFKISMWPFHMWAPDAYEGAPTPITAFLSVGPKLAGICVFVRVADTVFLREPHWPLVLAIASMITMTWGNLAALSQTNIKRMLAYSSIAQAGYLLVGVVALSVSPAAAEAAGSTAPMLSTAFYYAQPSVLVYALAYLVMNLGAFIVAIEVERATGTSEVAGFAGLSERSPVLAASLSIFLLGLAGIPLTAGFIGKLFLFGSAVAGATYGSSPILWALAGFGVVNSVISVFYYFRVVQPIWLESGADSRIVSNRAIAGLAAFLAVLTLGMGILGQSLIRPARDFQHVYNTPVIGDTAVAQASTTP